MEERFAQQARFVVSTLDVLPNLSPEDVLCSPLPQVMSWIRAKVELEQKKAEERKKAEDRAKAQQNSMGKSKGGVY